MKLNFQELFADGNYRLAIFDAQTGDVLQNEIVTKNDIVFERPEHGKVMIRLRGNGQESALWFTPMEWQCEI